MATVTQSEKELMRSKLISNPLSLISSSSLNSLIKLYKEEQSISDDIIIELVILILDLLVYHDILIAFAELVLKIKKIKDTKSEDPLETVLEDIKYLGRIILKLDEHHPSIITEIVAKALQPSEKKTFKESADGIVKINPKPKKGLLSLFIDWVVDHIIKFLHYQKSHSKFLEDNFAPVRKETSPPATDLIIQGQLPDYLNGIMLRNGPNPRYDPIANYAWVDGDGMIHSIYFKEGKATYASHYIRTSRFTQEQDFKRAEFIQYGDLSGAFGVFMACVYLLKQKLGILDISQGWFNANEGITYHAGLLLVSEDFDKPYAINVLENGDFETLGINNYHNKLTGHFNSHPKKDSNTGELFFLGISYTAPFLTYNVVDKDGYLNNSVQITSFSGPSYIHDFGITNKYVIFMDLSFRFDPEVMVKNKEWVYSYDSKKKARFGILPRNDKTQNNIKWFEFPEPFFIFHNGNAWEEDEDTVVLISCVMEEPKKYKANGKPWVFYSPGYIYDGSSHQRRNFALQAANKVDKKNESVKMGLPILHKLSFNLKTGECSRIPLTKTQCDYPKINDKYIGRRCRYIYTSEFRKDAKVIGIAKTDLKWGSEVKLNLGEGKYSSEVSFVSRQSTTPCEEDDGYLTSFVYHEDDPNSKSFAYVICAQTMSILATIELKNIRVPYGFHATFVTEEELKAQKSRNGQLSLE